MQTRRDIYTISRLNSELRQVLEGSFPLLWVQGEISNLSTPRSGHLYFSLKDAHAQIRCALFRNRRNLLRFTPANGEAVLVRARVALYEPRGDCQLIVEHMEPAGAGSLRQAFEALKTKLAAEGLFDTGRKRPLPAMPRRIGVISSPSGAALRDILHVLARRHPSAEVIIYPAAVQGVQAPAELRRALALALARQEVDVLIIGRGGGSEEDLAVFNDEQLARDIAAAELVSPDGAAIQARCGQLQRTLGAAMRRRLDDKRYRLQQLAGRLQRVQPSARLRQQQQRLDEVQLRLARAMRLDLGQARRELAHWRGRLALSHPGRRLEQLRARLGSLGPRLRHTARDALSRRRQRLQALARALHAVSPLATLERGYAIVQKAENGEVVRDAAQVRAGDVLNIRLAQGRIEAKVS